MIACMGLLPEQTFYMTPKELLLRWRYFNENRLREVKMLAIKVQASAMSSEIDVSELVLRYNETLNDGPNADYLIKEMKKSRAKAEYDAIEFKSAEEIRAAMERHLHKLKKHQDG